MYIYIYICFIHLIQSVSIYLSIYLFVCARGGARGVVVIAVGNEHCDTSSNPGRYWLHFT